VDIFSPDPRDPNLKLVDTVARETIRDANPHPLPEMTTSEFFKLIHQYSAVLKKKPNPLFTLQWMNALDPLLCHALLNPMTPLLCNTLFNPRVQLDHIHAAYAKIAPTRSLQKPTTTPHNLHAHFIQLIRSLTVKERTAFLAEIDSHLPSILAPRQERFKQEPKRVIKI
jgi:hypothetical protein